MPAAIRETIQVLELIVQELPIGTNLGWTSSALATAHHPHRRGGYERKSSEERDITLGE